VLVLSRKIGESVICHSSALHDVRVTVLKICGQQVKIGIEADRSVSIKRSESRPGARGAGRARDLIPELAPEG
jgi:carbon storage regulator CsrA